MDGSLKINVLVDQKMDRMGERWVDQGGGAISGGQIKGWIRNEMDGCIQRQVGSNLC